MSNNTVINPSITMLPLVEGYGQAYTTEVVIHPVYRLVASYNCPPGHKKLAATSISTWQEIPVAEFDPATDVAIMIGTNWVGSGLSKEHAGTWFHELPTGKNVSVSQDGMTLFKENKSERLSWSYRVRRAPADAPRLKFTVQARGWCRDRIATLTSESLRSVFYAWMQKPSHYPDRLSDETPFVIRAVQAAWMLAAAQEYPPDMNAEFAFVTPGPDEIAGLIQRLKALNIKIEELRKADEMRTTGPRKWINGYSIAEPNGGFFRAFHDGGGWRDITEEEVARAEKQVRELTCPLQVA